MEQDWHTILHSHQCICNSASALAPELLNNSCVLQSASLAGDRLGQQQAALDKARAP